jgi:spermidine synthase
MLQRMSRRFEELDFQASPIGDISLRRRLDPQLQRDVYEVKLGEEFLMSSLFTVAEIALATLGLAAHDGTDLDVVVGGLGLGYTAGAALEDERVRTVRVVEYLPPVIDWHQRRLLPLSPALADDPRCSFEHEDFFALGFAEADVILLDVDHSPYHVLHPSHAALYTTEGLKRLPLKENGVFALWSDDPPDERFLEVLRSVFPDASGHLVPFANPLTGGESRNSVYVAR